MQQPVYDAYTTQPTVYDQQPYMQAAYPHAGVYWDEYEEPYYDDEFDSYVRPRRERSNSRSRRNSSRHLLSPAPKCPCSLHYHIL